MPHISRYLTLVISVLLLHVAVIWAMHTRQQGSAAQPVVFAKILVTRGQSAALQPEQAPAPKPQTKAQAQAKVPSASLRPTDAPHTAPALSSLAPVASLAEPNATVQAGGTTTNAMHTASAASGKINAAAVVTPEVELPSKDADYLHNPKPPYPKTSWQLREQGRVVVRVWIGTDGQASQPSIKTSSGFDRLDQAAVNTVMAWRYVPGKRGRQAEAMWFDVPVNWVLQ